MESRCTRRKEDRPPEPHPLQAPGHHPLEIPAVASSGAARDGAIFPVAMATAASTRRRDVITPSPGAGAGEAASPGGAISEKSGGGAPRLARGRSAAWAPGPGNRDKQAGRRGEGGRAGAWPRAGHPGSGAPAEAAPGARGKCGRPGTWISREASRARAGGLWRRRVAGPALVAGPGAWRSVGGVALGGCQVGGRGKSGSTVPRGGRPGGRGAPGRSRARRAHPPPSLAWRLGLSGRRPGPTPTQGPCPSIPS